MIRSFFEPEHESPRQYVVEIDQIYLPFSFR
jgi:hypothetical protein